VVKEKHCSYGTHINLTVPTQLSVFGEFTAASPRLNAILDTVMVGPVGLNRFRTGGFFFFVRFLRWFLVVVGF